MLLLIRFPVQPHIYTNDNFKGDQCPRLWVRIKPGGGPRVRGPQMERGHCRGEHLIKIQNSSICVKYVLQ